AWVAAPESVVSVLSPPRTAVPLLPIAGRSPQAALARSEPAWASIHARSRKTSDSIPVSGAWQVPLVPNDAIPATTGGPAGSATKGGPPESPRQRLELLPGVPRGAEKLQQISKAFPGPEQEERVTAPARLTPPSGRSARVAPKPTIVPAVLNGGLTVVSIGVGAI